MTKNDYIKAIHEILRDNGGHITVYSQYVKINFFDNIPVYLDEVYQRRTANLDEIATYNECGMSCPLIQLDCLGKKDLKTVYDTLVYETK